MNKRIRRIDQKPIETNKQDLPDFKSLGLSPAICKELESVWKQIDGEYQKDMEEDKVSEEEITQEDMKIFQTSRQRQKEAYQRIVGNYPEEQRYQAPEPTEFDYLRMNRQVKIYKSQSDKEGDE